jgi:hypothetical protein
VGDEEADEATAARPAARAGLHSRRRRLCCPASLFPRHPSTRTPRDARGAARRPLRRLPLARRAPCVLSVHPSPSPSPPPGPLPPQHAAAKNTQQKEAAHATVREPIPQLMV